MNLAYRNESSENAWKGKYSSKLNKWTRERCRVLLLSFDTDRTTHIFNDIWIVLRGFVSTRRLAFLIKVNYHNNSSKLATTLHRNFVSKHIIWCKLSVLSCFNMLGIVFVFIWNMWPFTAILCWIDGGVGRLKLFFLCRRDLEWITTSPHYPLLRTLYFGYIGFICGVATARNDNSSFQVRSVREKEPTSKHLWRYHMR